MRTAEKYEEMGFTVLSETEIKNKHGTIYYPKKAKSPLKAIKFFCRECMGMSRKGQPRAENAEIVRKCTDPMCPLFDFRMGKNPFLKRIWTEKQKKEAAVRMSLLHRRD